MHKILIIHSGGTFGMVPVEAEAILAPGNLQHQILSFLPEIQKIADINVIVPFNLDSSNIGIKEWDLLTDLIHQNISRYDGFVIIHGTDTMVYTASALSFSLRNLKKPVILTGSQRPLSKLRSDARNNLIDAVELATLKVPEVLIVFGQKILRGNRSQKISISNYVAFDSPNFPELGEIGLNIVLNSKLFKRTKENYFLIKGFEPKVMILSIYPSLNPDYFLPLIDSDIQVVLLRGFGAGNLPNTSPDWLRLVSQLIIKKKMVFICSHSRHGSVDLDLYASGKMAQKMGAIGLGEISIEAAYVKLLKILTLTHHPDEIQNHFFTNWAGEI